jgi:hypothetical protein
VAKSPTRDRVNWFAAHEVACFLAETAGKLSGSVTPSLHYRYERLSRPAEKVRRPRPTDNATRMTDPK